MQQAPYPYLESSLADLEGEIWDDIPFLDGVYLISNFGRVKRLARDVYTSNGQPRHYKEKINRAYLDRNKNKSVNDESFFYQRRYRLITGFINFR